MQVDAEASDLGETKRRIDNVRLAVDASRMRWDGRQDGLLDIQTVQRALRQRMHDTVHANGRRRAGDKQ